MMYQVIDARGWGRAQVYGPFTNRQEAEQCVIAVASQPHPKADGNGKGVRIEEIEEE